MIARLLLWSSAASLLPVGGGALADAELHAQAARTLFEPPAGPMVLTRTVWKTLGDGKQIVVSRRYAVSFSRNASGFDVEGRLLDASVDAPGALAVLADIERRRADTGMFPIQLDARGWIHGAKPADERALGPRQEALKGGLRTIEAAGASAQEQREHAAQLALLAQQGIGGVWPSDLFNPLQPRRHNRREIALPDGQVGEVDVTIVVRAMLPSGLPEAVERTVVTRLGGTERVSREEWTLAPAPPPSA